MSSQSKKTRQPWAGVRRITMFFNNLTSAYGFFKNDGTQSSNVMIPCTTERLLSLQNSIFLTQINSDAVSISTHIAQPAKIRSASPLSFQGWTPQPLVPRRLLLLRAETMASCRSWNLPNVSSCRRRMLLSQYLLGVMWLDVGFSRDLARDGPWRSQVNLHLTWVLVQSSWSWVRSEYFSPEQLQADGSPGSLVHDKQQQEWDQQTQAPVKLLCSGNKYKYLKVPSIVWKNMLPNGKTLLALRRVCVWRFKINHH